MNTNIVTKAIGGTIATAAGIALLVVIKSKRDLKSLIKKERELLTVSEECVSALKITASRGIEGWKEKMAKLDMQSIIQKVNQIGFSTKLDMNCSATTQLDSPPSKRAGEEAKQVMFELMGISKACVRLCESAHEGSDAEYEMYLKAFNEDLKEFEDAIELLRAHLDCFK